MCHKLLIFSQSSSNQQKNVSIFLYIFNFAIFIKGIQEVNFLNLRAIKLDKVATECSKNMNTYACYME